VEETPRHGRWFLLKVAPTVYGLAGAAFLLEMAVSTRYGYHRDELYFIACAKHLAFGYVDQPPLTPILAGIGNFVFAGSLAGFRLIPALAMAGLVICSGLIARELGAGRFGQGFAALSVALTGEYLAGAHLVSPTIFDWLLWTVGFFLVLRLIRTGNLRLWLAVGALAGIGLENKWNILFFVFGLAIGLLATPQRRLLRSWWVLAAAVLALALWAPNLAWQASHGWPQLQVFSALNQQAAHNRAVFWPAQFIYVGLLLTPVWLAGLLWLLRNPAARAFRLFAWMYVAVMAVFFVLGGKPYYPGAMYTLLLAAGAVPAERYLRDPARRLLRPMVVVVALVIGAVALLPIALPVLPARVLATVPLQKINYDLAETIAWPRLVATVAGIYRSLPANERRSAVILTANYGEAGAVDRYGSQFSLPPAYSGHNNFWLWGPPHEPRGVTIAVNFSAAQLQPFFVSVRKVTTFTNGLGVQNDEQGAPIYVCSGQRESWAAMWPALRHYD